MAQKPVWAGERLLAWLVQTETKWNAQLLIHRRSFFLSLETFTQKHSRGFRTKPPFSAQRPRLCAERSCVGMSSVWITPVSQTHSAPDFTSPLLFTSSGRPLMTSRGSARLYIMSNGRKTWMVNREKQIPRCTLRSQSTTCEMLT